MTAVAPPPNFPNHRWSSANMPNTAMFMPRKNSQRSNSTSSLSSQSSQASSTSTVSAASSQQANGVAAPPAAEAGTWAGRKKAPRGIWPPAKTEPQSIVSTASAPSTTSAMTALQPPVAPMVPSQPPQQNGAVQAQQNGAPRAQAQEPQAILHLAPMNGTFERKTIAVPLFPDVLPIGRQTNNKTIPTPMNGYFDSKVLSRQHAQIWADRSGKIWIRDVKSSNGTFVNEQRLSQENRDSEPCELREHDKLELGIDIVSEDQKTIVHHKVAASVEHAGIYTNAGNSMMDLNFGELEGSQMSNLAGPNGQQQLAQMRGRTSSQGSMNGQRIQGPGGIMGNTGGGMQQPRHPNFWLQPITMEQVVKKLNAEMKAARQQSQDLQQTHSYINSILSTDPKKEQTKPSPMNSVRIKDGNLKARFSDPPAPPPQQPLPEKPDGQSSALRRTETERPKMNGSPVRSDAQMTTLTEALHNAKKEMESQTMRLQDLEHLLTEERRAREEAEARANRLERERDAAESDTANGEVPSIKSEEDGTETVVSNGSVSLNQADAAATRLQQKLDTMMSEMIEMKMNMDKYRERAESAEADRDTLAEMVESIRHGKAKQAKRQSRRDSNKARDATAESNHQADDDEELEEGEIMIINEELEDDGTRTVLRRAVQNGQPTERNGSADAVAKTSNALATHSNQKDFALTHGAPAVSILTVVALGVAVMAWLNNYSKVDR